MPRDAPPVSPRRASVTANRVAAARVARNSAGRALGEAVGKIATLALTVVLARETGRAGLGVYVFALAWAELTTALLGPGLDRLLMRRVATDRQQLGRLLGDILVLKALRGVPIVALSWMALAILGYAAGTRAVVYLMTVAYVLDAFNLTLLRAFEGLERAELVGLTLSVQRIVAAGLGLAAVLAGFGLRTIAAGYIVASAVALGIAFALLAGQAGSPDVHTDARSRRDLGRSARPFAAQEVLAGGLARLDAILISLLVGQSTVGVYGAAYRLFEATLLVSTALSSAFVAMFTYLQRDSEPSLGAVFNRALKVAVAVLVPVAVAMMVLPDSLLALIYGAKFQDGSGALRALGPTAVLLAVVILATTLVVSRRDPQLLLKTFTVGLAVNLGLNLALIPVLDATGAGLAMLGTELVLVVITLRLARIEVGRIPVSATFGAALLAGTAMGATLALLPIPLAPALLAAGVVYLVVFTVTEHHVAPTDLKLIIDLVRNRTGGKGS